jgi:hypothetical protein
MMEVLVAVAAVARVCDQVATAADVGRLIAQAKM